MGITNDRIQLRATEAKEFIQGCGGARGAGEAGEPGLQPSAMGQLEKV